MVCNKLHKHVNQITQRYHDDLFNYLQNKIFIAGILFAV